MASGELILGGTTSKTGSAPAHGSQGPNSVHAGGLSHIPAGCPGRLSRLPGRLVPMGPGPGPWALSQWARSLGPCPNGPRGLVPMGHGLVPGPNGPGPGPCPNGPWPRGLVPMGHGLVPMGPGPGALCPMGPVPMGPNGPKLVPNGPKLIPNGPKWSHMGPKLFLGPYGPKMGPNGPKNPKIQEKSPKNWPQ